MKRDRQTKEKLLKAAKEEFLDKGYMRASLRNICRKAEVTTGALYFFFQDKEDLFGALVEKPLRRIYEIMKEHYETEATSLPEVPEREDREEIALLVAREQEEHRKAAMRAVDYLYEYYEEFLLLLMKSQGSKYENCLDAFIELSEAHYRQMAEVMDRLTGKKGLDDDTLHCIVHLQVSIFIQPVTHGLEKEKARRQMTSMVKFLMGGWYGLWQ